MKIQIKNEYDFHYEIIESVIVKYDQILKINKYNMEVIIYLHIIDNKIFTEYIKSKYPNIIFDKIDNYDYCINCTIYDHLYNMIDNDISNKKYISHEITDRLKTNPNVFFLTPLSGKNFIYMDILPYSDYKIKSNIPIYLIQGNIDSNRRYFNLLSKILEKTYKYDFKIKLIGRGNLPKEFLKYKSKILLKNNLNYIDYHKEFSDIYCILPLISKKTHPQYYTKKITSSINYAKGYNLAVLIDKDLQNIYNLERVYIYNNIDDIDKIFENTLFDFYKKK
tara:strand:+ start:2786 stop:3622 length:837 start_codon:yes stop_codon:yes gene_type:complete